MMKTAARSGFASALFPSASIREGRKKRSRRKNAKNRKKSRKKPRNPGTKQKNGTSAAPGRSVLLAPLARGERKASFGARAKSAFALLLEKVTKPPADAGEKEFDESDN